MGFRKKPYPVNAGIRILVESLFRAVYRPVPHIPLPGIYHHYLRVEKETVPVRAAIVQQESDASLYLFLFGEGQGDNAVAPVYALQVPDVRTGFGDIEIVSGIRFSLAEHSGQSNVIYRMDGKVQAVYAVALVYGPQGVVVYAAFVQASSPEIDGISLADALRFGKEVGLVNVQFQRDGAVASVYGLQGQAVGAALPDIGEVETISVVPFRRADGITDDGMIYGEDGEVQCDNTVTPVYALQAQDMRAGFGNVETVSGVRASLANGVVQLNVIQRVYGEEEGTYGIASPAGFQGVADYRIGGDGCEVEAVIVVIAAIAYRIGKGKVRGRMYGQCQPENAVAAVDCPQGIVIHTACVQAFSPEINGIPLTDALECSTEIGLGNVQMQRNGAVTTMDGGVCFCKCATGCALGKVETVTVVAVPLADGVVEYFIVYRMNGEGEGADGIAPPAGFQGVADYRIGGDGCEVEAVIVVIAAIAYRIGKGKVRGRMYGQCQPENAVAAVDCPQGIVIHTACVQAFSPEINGIPLTDALECSTEIGLGNVQMQRNGAVTTMDGGVCFCKCATGCALGKVETVTVVAVILADSVAEYFIIYRMNGEEEGTYGIASPRGLQGVADYRIGGDGRKVESVIVVVAAVAYRIGETKVMDRVYGQCQSENAVAAVNGPQGIVIHATRIQAFPPEINGIPLADALRFEKEVRQRNIQMQRNGAVTTMDGGVCFRKCATGCPLGQVETVTVVAVSPADRIVKECFIWLLHGQMQIDDAVATCNRTGILETVNTRFRPDIKSPAVPNVGQILGANNDRSISDDMVTIGRITGNATDGKAIVFCHHYRVTSLFMNIESLGK